MSITQTSMSDGEKAVWRVAENGGCHGVEWPSVEVARRVLWAGGLPRGGERAGRCCLQAGLRQPPTPGV